MRPYDSGDSYIYWHIIAVLFLIWLGLISINHTCKDNTRRIEALEQRGAS
jgi:hypothetical protein